MSKTLAIKGGSKSKINQLMGWTDFDRKAIRVVGTILIAIQLNSRAYPKGMQMEE